MIRLYQTNDLNNCPDDGLLLNIKRALFLGAKASQSVILVGVDDETSEVWGYVSSQQWDVKQANPSGWYGHRMEAVNSGCPDDLKDRDPLTITRVLDLAQAMVQWWIDNEINPVYLVRTRSTNRLGAGLGNFQSLERTWNAPGQPNDAIKYVLSVASPPIKNW